MGTTDHDGDHVDDADVEAMLAGRHSRLQDVLGLHPLEHDRARAAVWAPHAAGVAVIHDGNGWDPTASPLRRRDLESGIWSGVVRGLSLGTPYKIAVTTQGGERVDHADPFARHTDTPPANASRLWRLDHAWRDDGWLARRRSGEIHGPGRPASIYEVHLGSWMRGEDGRRHLSYDELIPHLVPHVTALGMTHVELLPIAEHPFYGSWGYQTTGYFAPTSRYGPPEGLMRLIDALHSAGIAVLLDWVPSHFPDDWWGLARFDGHPLFEPADPQRARHPDWNSAMFDYASPVVRSFLLSSARWWLETYHADGLRVDAVASMLRLDHGRAEGEWTPNAEGGSTNLDALAFLRDLTTMAHREVPGAVLIAEDSSAFPGITDRVADGGVGFDRRWDMGWASDLLSYLGTDPINRRGMQDRLTFRSVYQHDDRFVLPLSHDEATPQSLLGRMHGDDWQARANLRALIGLCATQPGWPLLFMGSEFGAPGGWDVDGQLPWPRDSGDTEPLTRWTSRTMRAYRELPALHAGDDVEEGFAWISGDDADHSVIAFLRRVPGGGPAAVALVVAALTPVPREGYGIGVPGPEGRWRAVLSSDDPDVGGSGEALQTGEVVRTEATAAHGHPMLLRLTLPPLGLLVLAPVSGDG